MIMFLNIILLYMLNKATLQLIIKGILPICKDEMFFLQMLPVKSCVNGKKVILILCNAYIIIISQQKRFLKRIS